MKRQSINTFCFCAGSLLLLSTLLTGCETVIPVTLDSGPIQLAVDATIYNTPTSQTITLTQSAPYFSDGPVPVATGASVSVVSSGGRTFTFTDATNTGKYIWTPTNSRDSLGSVGQQFTLKIKYQGESYTAMSSLNRVPPIDSLVFQDAPTSPTGKRRGHKAQFYMTDIPGPTPDYYRIEFARNGIWQKLDKNITTIYNASTFGSNSNTDGLLLIKPGRQSINPDSLYNLNDVVTVRLTSITEDDYNFLVELKSQLTNTGLFSRPATNVPTNIMNVNPNGPGALGFFVTSVPRTMTRSVAVPNLRGSTD